MKTILVNTGAASQGVVSYSIRSFRGQPTSIGGLKRSPAKGNCPTRSRRASHEPDNRLREKKRAKQDRTQGKVFESTGTLIFFVLSAAGVHQPAEPTMHRRKTCTKNLLKKPFKPLFPVYLILFRGQAAQSGTLKISPLFFKPNLKIK